MVNSRCVFGSSIGIREFSASKTTNNPLATRTSGATGNIAHDVIAGAFSIGERESDPDNFASTRKARNNAGSEKHANVTPRAAPNPSNDDPVSSAADVVKNRASPNR